MPLTPSHAVVALPFIRTPLVPAAIAAGAMAPDVPLFVRTPLTYARTHDLRWIAVTVVLALVLLLSWRCVLRPALGELVPRAIAERLPETWDTDAVAGMRETFAPQRGSRLRSLLLLVVSLVIGVVSHIAWDAFTHEGRAGVELIPALARQWGPLSGYQWAQHLSSAVGLLILIVWACVTLSRRRRVRSTGVLPSFIRALWWLSIPATAVIAFALARVTDATWGDAETRTRFVYGYLVPAGTVWLALTALLCVAVVLMRGRRSVP